MRGGNSHVRWERSCEVNFIGGGGDHIRVGGTQGGNGYMRLELSHKVTFQGWWRGPYLTCTQGGNGHAR